MKAFRAIALLSTFVVAALGGNAHASLRDPTFGDNGRAMNTPSDLRSSGGLAVAVQADSKLVVGGICERADVLDYDFCVWRFQADGRADLAFGTAGMTRTPVPGVNARPDQVALDAAGNIYLTGGQGCNLSQGPSQLCRAVLRYTSTGQLDTRFNGTGIKVIQAPELGASLTGAKLSVRSDGRVLLAGLCNSAAQAGLCLLGMRPDGTPDLSIGTSGLRKGASEIGYTSSIRIASNGTIKIIGQCQIDGARLCILHYLADGSPDTSYGPKGIVVSSLNQGFSRSTFSDDGRAIGVELCAPVLQIPPKICVSRLTYIGNTDMSFANGTVQSAVFDDQTYLSVGGVLALDDDRSLAFGTCNGNNWSTSLCVAVFTTLGELDTSFGSGGTLFESGQKGTGGLVRHLNERVISVGSCTGEVNGSTRFHEMCLVAIQANAKAESPTRQAIEYRNAALDYYFLTSRKSEQDLLDAVPGWSRTGNVVRVLAHSGTGTRPLVRFYFDQIAQSRSRGLHFYTSQESEIGIVQSLNASNQRSPRLPFNEGIDAFVYPAGEDGQCAAGTTPVYRAFRGNGRFPDDPNHRFTTDINLYAQLVRDGWDAEGVKFCAPQ